MIAFKKFYHCKLKTNRERPTIKEYEKPVLKWGNYQPLSGYLDVAIYGKDIGTRWRLSVNNVGNEKEYAVGDLLYLDGEIPPIENEDYENGYGANAIVTAVNIGYKLILVELERIVPQS